MKFKLPVSEEGKFRWLVEVFSINISPFNKLRPKEKDVLASLYYQNYINRNIPAEQRDMLTFHTESKKMIAEKLNISMDNMYNIIMSLKKSGLTTDKGFNMKYLIQNTDEITITFINTVKV